jgi:hypothetical protein
LAVRYTASNGFRSLLQEDLLAKRQEGWFVLKIAAVGLSVLCLMLVSVPMSAQFIPHGNVYGGVSYEDSDYVINQYTFRGWNASVEDIPFPRLLHLGVVIDASGFYRKGLQQYNLLLGPRYSFTYGRWRPFVHVLGGVQRVNSSGTLNNPIAIDGGGGVDYKLSSFWIFKNFSWRMQADYVHTRFLSANNSAIRGSTGFVWRF